MTHIRNFFKRSGFFLTALAILATWIAGDAALFVGSASAAQITNRTLTVASSADGATATGAAGSGTNGAKTKHTFTFTTSGASVGSIEFQYCTTPLPGTTCTAPTGLDVSTVTTVGGTSATGWTLGTLTASRLRITHTAATVTTLNFAFGNGNTGTDYIKNPTTINTSFFVRITTFSDTAYTTSVDQGTVANSTSQQITITAKVQETLNFSVGSPVSGGTGSVPAAGASCTPFSDAGNLQLGDNTDGTLSFSQAYDAHSYFRVSTNANGGTAILYSGDTLKNPSGNSIAAIGATKAQSAIGTPQFGLAIDSGDATTNGFSFTNLSATAPYDTGNGTIATPGAYFAYETTSLTSPKQIASASGTITCDTGSVRYLGNIGTTTPPGIYTTKISFIATPTY